MSKQRAMGKQMRQNGAAPTDQRVNGQSAPKPAVIVKIVEHEPEVFNIDPDALTWEDMEELMELYEKETAGKLTARESNNIAVDLLIRITGVTDLRKRPARVVKALIDQLGVIAGMEAQTAKN